MANLISQQSSKDLSSLFDRAPSNNDAQPSEQLQAESEKDSSAHFLSSNLKAFLFINIIIMPKGPFASSVGIGRAEPEWAKLNKVTEICGTDRVFNSGELSEAPLDLGPEIMSGDLSTCPKEVDLLIVGAGLSGAVIAERCSKELGMTSIVIDKRYVSSSKLVKSDPTFSNSCCKRTFRQGSYRWQLFRLYQ